MLDHNKKSIERLKYKRDEEGSQSNNLSVSNYESRERLLRAITKEYANHIKNIREKNSGTQIKKISHT